MSQNLILVVSAAMTLSFFLALFIPNKERIWFQVASLLCSVVNAVCASIAFADQMTAGSSRFEWVLNWFSFSDTITYSIIFELEPWSAFVWLLSALLFVFFDTLAVATNRSMNAGTAAAKSLIAGGVFLSILAGNLLLVCFGWALIGFAVFLGLAAGRTGQENTSDHKGRAALRFYCLDILCQAALFVGVLALGPDAGVKTFASLSKTVAESGGLKDWVAALLLFGVVSRSMQFPLLSFTRYFSDSDELSPLFFTVAHLAIVAVFFNKIGLLFVGMPLVHYYALVPALSSLFAAAYAWSEKRWNMRMGWLAAYLCGSALTAALQEGPQASILISTAGAAALFLLTQTRSVLPEGSSPRKWFFVIGALSLAAVPGSALAQGRLFGYSAILHLANDGNSTSWAVLGFGVIADIFVVLTAWRLIKGEFGFEAFGQLPGARTGWQTIIPLALNAALCFSFTLGGRPLSGLLGLIEVELAGVAVWFDSIEPPTSSMMSVNMKSIVGNDVDMTARALLFGVFILSTAVSLIWLYREKKRAQDFSLTWERFMAKLDIERLLEYIYWKIIFNGVSRIFGRFFFRFDNLIFDQVSASVVRVPVEQVSKMFRFIDRDIIDHGIVDGLAKSSNFISKSLKRIQTGNLHAYILFGLMTTGAMIAYYALTHGG